MSNSLKEDFNKIYGLQPEALFKAPARVNLIGEHIDYNGGMVLPAAISLYTYVAVSFRNDKKVCLSSNSFNLKPIEIELNDIIFKEENDWANYPIGVIDTLNKLGHKIDKGLNLYFDSNIPLGSGLSSSASILVLTCYMLNDLFELGLTNKELAEISTKSEREFNGLTCGIMDEAIIALGKENKCLYLNTSDFTYSYHDIDLGDYVLAILKTNKPRKLTDSKYNERVAECKIALEHVKKKKPIENLCKLNSDELYLLDGLESTIQNRAIHVIKENERVKRFIEAFKNKDLPLCGKILNESHYSLRDLYNVTGFHLDTITDIARNFPGVLGARMTGAGFGGCAIAFVLKDNMKEFENKIIDEYFKITGIKSEVLFCQIVDGPSRI